MLTGHDADDGGQAGRLLQEVDEAVASFTADGAYDRDDVHAEVTARHPKAEIIVPPRSRAVPSAAVETASTARDRHLQTIAERGRMGWQRASGYNWRAWSRPMCHAESASLVTDCVLRRTDAR